MDSFFIDKIVDDKYQISFVDKNRIFNAENPGILATVFECSNKSPFPCDDAQIFYALSPSINGLNFLTDLTDKNKTCKLNTWSINCKGDNILSVKQLNYEQRLELYSERHNISPENIDDNSLDSLIKFSQNQQKWKTGILQKCINCLVYVNYRNNPKVYTMIDLHYRKVMRFKYETENKEISELKNIALVDFIRKITVGLGIQHTRDTKIFKNIPDSINSYLTYLKTKIPKLQDLESLSLLSELFNLWCGSKIITVDGGYQIQIDDNITQCLTYLQPLLKQPKYLKILEAPM